MGLRKYLLGALVAICAVAMAAEDAQAFWGSRGSAGSWGSGGSSGSWGSRGSWGSCGSHGGILGRWRARRASHGSNGSYGSAGSAGSHGSAGSYGSHGGYAAVTYNHGGEHYAASERPTYAPSYVARQSAPSAKTKLTLRVPADAKVTLAGVQTKQTGEVREFSTSQLSAGQEWSNYTVHVEYEQNGETIARDETVTLTGGTSQELSFGVDEPMQVAQL